MRALPYIYVVLPDGIGPIGRMEAMKSLYRRSIGIARFSPFPALSDDNEVSYEIQFPYKTDPSDRWAVLCALQRAEREFGLKGLPPIGARVEFFEEAE